MTCKDCAHEKVCVYIELGVGGNEAKRCIHFAKPPIKIGDRIYQKDAERVYEHFVTKIIYETTGVAFDERTIGERVFLTKAEAEDQEIKRGGA